MGWKIMKIFTLAPSENWVCDRFVQEWNKELQSAKEHSVNTKEKVYKPQDLEVVNDARQSDLVWVLADWCWKKIDPNTLSRKRVIATVHHIVPEKFGDVAKKEFEMRDQFVDAYHVPCELTKRQIESLTNKPIYVFPFWVNQNIWFPQSREEVRKKYNIDNGKFLIGSFQRDTEGHDLKSPKLEKGPDIFCDIVEKLHGLDRNIEVVLSGWRRQYVMGRLNKAGVKYHYIELPQFSVINDLYNLVDLYLVGSRYEGGPQSVFECAATKTPIISTKVGYAPELLSSNSLIEDGATWGSASSDEVLEENYKKVSNLFIPNGMKRFENMMKEVMLK